VQGTLIQSSVNLFVSQYSADLAVKDSHPSLADCKKGISKLQSMERKRMPFVVGVVVVISSSAHWNESAASYLAVVERAQRWVGILF
jgi:hypothetical protein